LPRGQVATLAGPALQPGGRGWAACVLTYQHIYSILLSMGRTLRGPSFLVSSRMGAPATRRSRRCPSGEGDDCGPVSRALRRLGVSAA
jgi:hypothetical protein